MTEEFIQSVRNYLDTVNRDNFSEKYDGLVYIVKEYNKKGLGKKTIEFALYNYYRGFGDSLNTCREEVLLEICNRVGGFCNIYNDIEFLSHDDSP
jgi:GNAT superfamily N-acetyltransferase